MTISAGRVLCERCALVFDGGSESDRVHWLLNHDCDLIVDEDRCQICGGNCGEIFCWEDHDAG